MAKPKKQPPLAADTFAVVPLAAFRATVEYLMSRPCGEVYEIVRALDGCKTLDEYLPVKENG